MTYDPFHFVFDKSVRDTANGVRLDVTVIDADPESDVQINLHSGALRIAFFLKPYHAKMLARYLLQACDAYTKAVSENLTPSDD